jgi:hypothetical protein
MQTRLVTGLAESKLAVREDNLLNAEKGERCVLMLSTIPSLAHYAPVVADDKNSVVTCELAFGVIYIVVSNAKGNQLLLRVPRTQMTFGNTFCASSLYYACTMTIISSSSSL